MSELEIKILRNQLEIAEKKLLLVEAELAVHKQNHRLIVVEENGEEIDCPIDCDYIKEIMNAAWKHDQEFECDGTIADLLRHVEETSRFGPVYRAKKELPEQIERIKKELLEAACANTYHCRTGWIYDTINTKDMIEAIKRICLYIPGG